MKGTAGAVVRRGVREGVRVAGGLLLVVIPLYVLIDLLKDTPLVTSLGRLVAPLMRAMGLPGEAAIPFVIASVNNLYSAIAAMEALNLSPRQVTIMGIVLGISHNLFVETGVLTKAGTRGYLLSLYRLGAAVAVGCLAAVVLPE